MKKGRSGGSGHPSNASQNSRGLTYKLEKGEINLKGGDNEVARQERERASWPASRTKQSEIGIGHKVS